MGRPCSGRLLLEEHHSIDVRIWQRQRLLISGRSFPCSWTQEGNPCGGILVFVEPDAVVLSFCIRLDQNTEGTIVRQRVPLACTSCHFGGGRRWFVCTNCGRRVAKLFAGGRSSFACRACCGLQYASQRESLRYRGIERARKIRMTLGGDANVLNPLPNRPKGMHRSRYEHLQTLYDARTAQLDNELNAMMQRRGWIAK